MKKHKIGDFVFNGDSWGIIVDVVEGSHAPYRVRWRHDTRTYSYVNHDIRIFKQLLDTETR